MRVKLSSVMLSSNHSFESRKEILLIYLNTILIINQPFNGDFGEDLNILTNY